MSLIAYQADGTPTFRRPDLTFLFDDPIHPHEALFLQHREGGIDFRRFLIAMEDIPDFSSGEAISAAPQGGMDLIRHGITERITEDEPCRPATVLPYGQRRSQMLFSDLCTTIEQSVNGGEAHSLRLRARSHGSEESPLSLTELAINATPERSRRIVPRHLFTLASKLSCRLNLPQKGSEIDFVQ